MKEGSKLDKKILNIHCPNGFYPRCEEICPNADIVYCRQEVRQIKQAVFEDALKQIEELEKHAQHPSDPMECYCMVQVCEIRKILGGEEL